MKGVPGSFIVRLVPWKESAMNTSGTDNSAADGVVTELVDEGRDAEKLGAWAEILLGWADRASDSD
jgi:hypothetical protein